MRAAFDPRGKGGSIVREIAALLAQNEHRGIHVEWAPPRKQARHDAYRLRQDHSGVWHLTINVSGEPRVIARLGALSPDLEVEVRRKLDELFGIEIAATKEGAIMAQDQQGSGEVAMPALPVDDRPVLAQKPVSAPVPRPTGDSFNKEWLLMILEALLEGKEEVTVIRLYRVIMRKAGELGVACDHSKISKALAALQNRKDAAVEVNRQGVSSTWIIRRKTSEAVQAVEPPTPEEPAVSIPSMTEEGVLVVKEPVSVTPAPAPEASAVPAPAFTAQDPLSMVLARQMSPEEFCDALRDLPMAKAVEIITRLVNMQAQIRRLLTTIANDEVFAMMRALVARISAEKEE